jgi:hypothetical protein
MIANIASDADVPLPVLAELQQLPVGQVHHRECLQAVSTTEQSGDSTGCTRPQM